MTEKITTPRPAQGKRPQYFDDPNMDQMHAMIIALATEVSVLTDRFDTIERVLEDKGAVSRADIEGWEPDEDAWEDRREKRDQLIRRLFRSTRESRTTLEGQDGPADE
ncbi:MAG: hypothetical protein HN793_07260 [Rhodospirillaceae bacterium]|jgi:hypothetical protein|nr:hypothetical protein [Rhodospirillaceae bacterium]MBT5565946.1 hypothetical protein [Rhodospirillaceae bacterium]MBT6088634.1 hypothetical protein [Rhodospirillaceae bacterium]MBT7450610.1 hypothetical protein [Rhodospirillaceae bacterium]